MPTVEQALPTVPTQPFRLDVPLHNLLLQPSHKPVLDPPKESAALPEPVFPQHPELLHELDVDDISAHDQVRSTGWNPRLVVFWRPLAESRCYGLISYTKSSITRRRRISGCTWRQMPVCFTPRSRIALPMQESRPLISLSTRSRKSLAYPKHWSMSDATLITSSGGNTATGTQCSSTRISVAPTSRT